MFRFEWNFGNLQKLEKVKASGRDFTRDELESIFNDTNKIIGETTTDPISGEQRYICIGLSNLSRVLSVIFVSRIDSDGEPTIRIFNGWKTKGSKLKLYHETAN